MAFSLFNSFPPEIHSLILSTCAPNDRTCLSLTCKYLYELNTSNDLILLGNEDDLAPLCANSELSSAPFNAWNRHYFHRSQCHDASFNEATKRNEQAGLPLPKQRKCRTNRWAPHCECFSGRSKLYQRLRTWVPKGLNYCGRCHKFTRRKKSHNGRCYHGLPKPRHREPKYWTHYSRRGAFGRKLWKKWFTNSHMNAFEKKLGVQRDRAGRERYAMRTLEPKHLDTREVRYSYW